MSNILEIGTLISTLEIISRDHQNSGCEIRFQKTLDEWLSLTPQATWRTLEIAITI